MAEGRNNNKNVEDSNKDNENHHDHHQECSPCRDLLTKVFERIDSRPHRLVASMMQQTKIEWRQVRHGLQIKIPTEESRPPVPIHDRKWSRTILETEDSTSAAASRFGAPLVVQATSSTPPSLILGASGSTTYEPDGALPKDAEGSVSAATTTSSSSFANSSLPLTEWMNVSCEVCPSTGPKGKARAFVNGPQPLDVVVCSNRLREAPGSTAAVKEMEEILTHELVHVYDARQLQLDLRECQNLAYSEVRAAREAECASVPIQFGLKSSCVRERALLATQNLFPRNTSRSCLQRVFPHAYKDGRPFSSSPEKINSSSALSSSFSTTRDADIAVAANGDNQAYPSSRR